AATSAPTVAGARSPATARGSSPPAAAGWPRARRAARRGNPQWPGRSAASRGTLQGGGLHRFLRRCRRGDQQRVDGDGAVLTDDDRVEVELADPRAAGGAQAPDR